MRIEQKKLFWQMSILPIILAAILALIILLFGQFLPQKLPLFYSLPWGEQQLATPKQFLIIPAVLLASSLINLSLGWQLHPSQFLFKQILDFTSLILSIVLTVTFLKIVFIFI